MLRCGAAAQQLTGLDVRVRLEIADEVGDGRYRAVAQVVKLSRMLVGPILTSNAVAEVVSVMRGESAGYCMRFVALSDSDRRRIAKLVSDRKL